MLQFVYLIALLLQSTVALSDELELVVHGIDEPLLSNVEARTSSFRISGNSRLSRRHLERLQADAERRAEVALRPFGYYHPVISSELRAAGDRKWALSIHIDRGPPIIVSAAEVKIEGPGKDDPNLQRWQADWPLVAGSVLDQAVWEEQKSAAVDLADAFGYLGAAFREQLISLDLEQNQARLVLTLDTGEQAVMGSIVFNQETVQPGVLEHLPRFSEGQAYDAWLMEQFRLDLWRTGFFNDIEVLEERRLEDSPPLVNLVVNLEPRNLNTYQGSLSYGSDSGFRVQATWNRHLLSSRGDSLDVGFGYQQKDNQFNSRVYYRIPRKVAARQYWTAEALYRTEHQRFNVHGNGVPGQGTTIARGNVDDYSLKPGWLRIRDLKRGYQQIFEHWYVQYLIERSDFRLVENLSDELAGWQNPQQDLYYTTGRSETAALGVSWDWPVVRGNGFATIGHSHRAWIFTSNTAWGSDFDFSQVYASTRWNMIWNKRWKFLLRGEAGYSDARIKERLVPVGDELISLSVTELPSAYRFKAGGSQSVRGYGFEDLSNNNIGSNNIVTASAEVEMLFREKWSAAAFIDVGNAFNNWDQVKLKKGVGVGVRWYSIAGAIRLDLAQALDEPGKPWRLHFTIGSPLL